MSEYAPVRTKDELSQLDEAEMLAGYYAGFSGDPEPGSDRSRSFWHGWRNGRVDGGHDQIDCHQVKLAREVVGTYHGLH
jgi:hypothetical protein